MKYARGLGQRPSDPEYCDAISGPRPAHNAPAYWVAAVLLPILVIFLSPFIAAIWVWL